MVAPAFIVYQAIVLESPHVSFRLTPNERVPLGRAPVIVTVLLRPIGTSLNVTLPSTASPAPFIAIAMPVVQASAGLSDIYETRNPC